MEPIRLSKNLLVTRLPKCNARGKEKQEMLTRLKQQNPELVETEYTKKEGVLMTKMLDFYSYTPHLDVLIRILQKKSKISLRILDYFVTNYSPVYNVRYYISFYGRRRQFNVHSSYRSQLDYYHKRLFDPFCRRKRFYFEYAPGCEIETTPGQLNFFKWAIENGIIEYVEDNLKKIQDDMNLKNAGVSTSEEVAERKAGVAMTLTGTVRRENGEIVANVEFMEGDQKK